MHTLPLSEQTSNKAALPPELHQHPRDERDVNHPKTKSSGHDLHLVPVYASPNYVFMFTSMRPFQSRVAQNSSKASFFTL
jgi:hypothetical protein